jgi:hypothetical protein
MTAGVQPIAAALDAAARRKRARRFWGAMGAMLRFDDRRPVPADIRSRGAGDRPVIRIDPRARHAA